MALLGVRNGAGIIQIEKMHGASIIVDRNFSKIEKGPPMAVPEKSARRVKSPALQKVGASQPKLYSSKFSSKAKAREI
jgi:hypothetical protein